MDPRLWALALGNFAVGTASLLVAGILPDIASGLNISVALAGQLVTIYGVMLAVGAPLLGMITGRMERGSLMLVGLTIVALSCLVSAFATNYTVMALSRALAGLGAALFTPNAGAVAAQLVAPERRGRAIAVVFAGFSLSTVLGFPLGTCTGGAFGWRSAFGIVAVIAAMAIVMVARTLPRAIPVPLVSLRNWFLVFRETATLRAVTTTVLYMAGQYTLFTYIAALLAQQSGISTIGLSVLLVWFGVAGVLGNALVARVVDRVGAGRVATIGIGILLTAFLIMAYGSASLPLTVIAMGLWGGAAFAINSAQQARLVGLNPPLASATLALNAAALYGGQASGAAIGGIVVSVVGLQRVPWAGIVLLATALVVSAWKIYQRDPRAQRISP